MSGENLINERKGQTYELAWANEIFYEKRYNLQRRRGEITTRVEI